MVEMSGMRMRAATVCEMKVATVAVKVRMTTRASQGVASGRPLVTPSDR